jgi:hypothetical protein
MTTMDWSVICVQPLRSSSSSDRGNFFASALRPISVIISQFRNLRMRMLEQRSAIILTVVFWVNKTMSLRHSSVNYVRAVP